MKYLVLSQSDTSLKLISPSYYEGEIAGPCPIDSMKQDHFVFIRNEKFLKRFLASSESSKNCRVGIVIAESLWNSLSSGAINFEMVNFISTSNDIDISMCKLSKIFFDQIHDYQGDLVDGRDSGEVDIDPTARIAQGVFIGRNVRIGKDVIIHPNCTVLSNSIIDDETILFPSVSIYQRVTIQKRCRIHSNVVIGSDGFGYNFAEGVHHKIWHFGGVVVEDDVEIGANTAIDSGTFSPTLIGRGTKIDNCIQIGHNCKVGQGVIMCGQSGLSGSCVIGDFTVMGGKSGIGPDVELGKGCQIAGSAMVSKSWPDKSVLAGHPARHFKEWIRSVSYLNKIADKKNS